MFNLKEKDINTWNMFESGNFSVNKFSEIGADHALKQENRAAKAIGGIKGIGNNENAVGDYFLTAAEMRNILESFCANFNLDDKEARKREEHYQLTVTKNTHLTENIKKILEVFHTHDINFET